MKCPRCGSDNVTYSHRRGMEKILRYFWPRVPYRCKECWTRYWKFENIFQAAAVSGGILAVIIIILLAVMFKGGQTPKDEPEPVKPVAERTSEPDELEMTELYSRVDDDINEQDNDTPAEETHVGTGSTPEVRPDIKPDIKPEPDITPVPEKVKEPPKDPVPDKKEVKPATAEKKPVKPVAKVKDSFRILKAIRSKGWNGYFNMVISADESIKKYKAFPLNNPPRLVINIYGKWKSHESSAKEVKSDLVSKVRIGEHPDYISVVLDIKNGKVPTPVIKESSEGLDLTLRK
ncbi:MAG: AMIN domain-containing protein [Desulfobacteraceae bacterium]|nr:AMIN domain-containing protein [Desulfobacteraceae bacterium]